MARTGRPKRDEKACETFASNLDKIMTKKRYRNNDLALALSIPPATISKWRNAKQYPSGQSLTEMAKELKTTVETLTS